MNQGFAYRSPLICLLIATTGVALLAGVWSQYGAGDTPPPTLSPSPSPTVGELEFTPRGIPVRLRESPPASVAPGPLPATTAPTGSSSEVTHANSSDEELKAKFHGIWTHSENGNHWIENRPDGTARMLLKLDFVASLLYGKQTHLDLTWDVQDGVLSHTIVSGTPVTNVNSLVKDYGKSRHYTILETTPERMLLQSLTDKQKDLWTRTPAPPEWDEVPSPESMPPKQQP